MSLETLLQTFLTANIQSEEIDGKIASITIGQNSTLPDSEAWDLIDSEGLRYTAPEPVPIPDPNYVEWRKAEIALPEFRQVCNQIAAIDATLHSSLMIAFGKVTDKASLENAVVIWNLAIHLITITPEQVTAIQSVCDQYYVPLNIRLNGEIGI